MRPERDAVLDAAVTVAPVFVAATLLGGGLIAFEHGPDPAPPPEVGVATGTAYVAEAFAGTDRDNKTPEGTK